MWYNIQKITFLIWFKRNNRKENTQTFSWHRSFSFLSALTTILTQHQVTGHRIVCSILSSSIIPSLSLSHTHTLSCSISFSFEFFLSLSSLTCKHVCVCIFLLTSLLCMYILTNGQSLPKVFLPNPSSFSFFLLIFFFLSSLTFFFSFPLTLLFRFFSKSSKSALFTWYKSCCKHTLMLLERTRTLT